MARVVLAQAAGIVFILIEKPEGWVVDSTADYLSDAMERADFLRQGR